MGTRAEGDMDGGIGPEKFVKSIRVVLYDESNVARYSWYYDDIDSDGDGAPTGDDVFAAADATRLTLKAQEVVIQPYKLLVLVNPVDKVMAVTEEGDDYSDLTEAATIDAAALTGSDGGFFMSNHQGLVPVAISNLKESAEEAQNAPVPVNVDRGVAKVSVRQGISFKAETDNGKAVLMNWGLDVTNRSMYWVRRMANTVKAGGFEAAEKVDDLRVNIYAEDPNFKQGYSHEAWEDAGGDYTLAPGEPSDYFLYASEGDIDIPLSTEATYDYCLENTMVASEQWHDVTTSIIVKARWIPKTSALETAVGEIEPGVSNPYFVFRGIVFTAKELDEIREGAIAEDLLPSSVADMRGAIAAILEDGGAFGNTSFAEFAASAPRTSVTVGELSYNADGINYYRVPIRHFDNVIQPDMMEYGRFGVVRNNVYELTINSISGPGRITIPPPEFEDEWMVGFISARLLVLPWILRDYAEYIGEDNEEPEMPCITSTTTDINPPTTP
jgi:hypothetical protein